MIVELEFISKAPFHRRIKDISYLRLTSNVMLKVVPPVINKNSYEYKVGCRIKNPEFISINSYGTGIKCPFINGLIYDTEKYPRVCAFDWKIYSCRHLLNRKCK